MHHLGRSSIDRVFRELVLDFDESSRSIEHRPSYYKLQFLILLESQFDPDSNLNVMLTTIHVLTVNL
jgi:hypothetical protein